MSHTNLFWREPQAPIEHLGCSLCCRRMSHVTRMQGSHVTFGASLGRRFITTYMRESRHTYEWVMWKIRRSHIAHTNESNVPHSCDMTYSHVRRDTFMCVTWLIQVCDMTICMCDMSQTYNFWSWVRFVMSKNESCHTYTWVNVPILARASSANRASWMRFVMSW